MLLLACLLRVSIVRAFHRLLMCLAVDKLRLIFGIDNFLAAVQSVVAGEHIADGN